MIQKKTRVSAALALGSALALAGCETVAESVDETYSASLSGAQEVPGPGDTAGSGNAEITVVDAVDNVCYEINVAGLSPATAPHTRSDERPVRQECFTPCSSPWPPYH